MTIKIINEFIILDGSRSKVPEMIVKVGLSSLKLSKDSQNWVTALHMLVVVNKMFGQFSNINAYEAR